MFWLSRHAQSSPCTYQNPQFLYGHPAESTHLVNQSIIN